MKKTNKQSKKILEYTAVFTREKDGRYSVSFPSLPGCVTFGNDLDHAQEMAQEVLELWLDHLLESKKPIPVEKSKPKTYVNRIKVSLVSASK